MHFNSSEEALQYLRGLDAIIMPPQFTYFNHCTSFQAEALQKNQLLPKSWTQLPIDDFVISRPMSFTERNQRIEEALGYGSRECANISYARPNGTKSFIIRVIMPKRHLSEEEKSKLNIDEKYSQLLQQEYMGLGDMRHPKLRSKEHIFMFASSTIDEVSGQKVDILYGVREQDLIRYASFVKETLSIKTTYRECELPTPTQVPGQAYYEWDHDYHFNTEVYSIPRDKTLKRYLRKNILGPNGEVALIRMSDFEREYLNELKEFFTNSEECPLYSSKSYFK